MVSWWHRDRVIAILIDSNTTVGENCSTAAANDNSIMKIDCADDNGKVIKEAVHGLGNRRW